MHASLKSLPLPRCHAAHCDVRQIESASAAEYYLLATPGTGSPARQADDIYRAVARHMADTGSFIVEERVFASSDALPALVEARAAALGAMDDGVTPTLLTPALGPDRPIAGVQVHTVRGPRPPTLFRHRDVPFARLFSSGGLHYLTATALRCPRVGSAPLQYRCSLESAESLLAAAGGSLADVARTWIWMDDILSWYDDLNRERTAFFTWHGLMSRPGQMPASTGIGVSPASRSRVSLDLFAAWGAPDAVERFSDVGNQRSAYNYGSAFSRAARVRTPAGTTVFCSGTAAIDAAGRTCHAGDAVAQVEMTLDNVAAVLRDMGCTDADVVQAMAYCATPAAYAYFEGRRQPGLPWPCLAMPGTVCRDDLQFEVEVTACPGARRR